LKSGLIAILTIKENASIIAPSWDGYTGGIVTFKVTDLEVRLVKLTLRAPESKVAVVGI